MKGERITKGWKVVGRDKDGKLVQLSRVYHSKPAADEFARLADADYTDVEVRTVEGYDRRPGT
jgi:hypothetical protein